MRRGRAKEATIRVKGYVHGAVPWYSGASEAAAAYPIPPFSAFCYCIYVRTILDRSIHNPPSRRDTCEILLVHQRRPGAGRSRSADSTHLLDAARGAERQGKSERRAAVGPYVELASGRSQSTADDKKYMLEATNIIRVHGVCERGEKSNMLAQR